MNGFRSMSQSHVKAGYSRLLGHKPLVDDREKFE